MLFRNKDVGEIQVLLLPPKIIVTKEKAKNHKAWL
jgi:hypothetical protein